jgi:DNA polymerase-1
MRHHIFEEADTYPIAILIKGAAFGKPELQYSYVTTLNALGVTSKEVIAFNLEYDQAKVTVKFIKEYLSKLLPALDSIGTRLLYVADAAYFKTLTGSSKADPHFGYLLPCKIKGFEHMNVVLGLNHQALIYNPAQQAKLDMSLETLAAAHLGSYQALGTGIIHSASYPSTLEDIAGALEALHQHPSLTCDIETFSLQFNNAGIGTIAFAWNQHNGIAFRCDYEEYEAPMEGFYGWEGNNIEIKALLRNFFETYQGTLTFHNATFDVKILVFELWMKDSLDNEGLLKGLEIMTKRIHDTKIIAYLALNSTAGNQLGLKTLAHEFAGNWAVEEIKDITRLTLPKLLQYNLVDALSTHYVRDKHYPTMVADNQEELYHALMLPSMKLIIQMELVGMPMCRDTIKRVKAKLEEFRNEQIRLIRDSALIQTLNLILQTSAMESANAKLKKKQHPLDKFSDLEFNPNSGPQLQKLLYEQLYLPVLDLTDTKQPATGAETLEKLINHTEHQEHKNLLAALIAYGKVNKILSTFIPAFERAVIKGDGWSWLHGSFNLNGTVSGRLSSSEPNLQNIPANSDYAKLIKECFVAAFGWIFAGADFNSLEDYVSALTTKDPNKLSVYERGFDGHCLRAAYYFREQCPEIQLDSPISVNSIKELYPDLRQDSKMPTFALTYQGTWHTLVSNLGLPEDKAKAIEANYHELYKVSDEYIQKRLAQASVDGYVDVAFGLRVRTPLLKQVMYGSSKVPYEAAAEGRTAGNAMGQSYGLLNNRAAVEFFQKVWASKYRNDIKPVALIHDAIYILIRDDVEVVEWANRELIKSMQWQELPELEHPAVKLGAALDLFWPSWANKITLPNDADKQTIMDICNSMKQKLLEPA